MILRYKTLNRSGRIGNKGSLHTLESAISVIIMIIILSLVIRNSETSEEGVFTKKKLEVYDALKFSDRIGRLRPNVETLNATSIEGDITSYSGPGFEYYTVIYDENEALTAEPLFVGDDVLSVSYVISGVAGSYDPREVRVYIWR